MKNVTQKKATQKVQFQAPLWVGIDVHKRTYSVAIIDREGQREQFSMAADNDALVKRLHSYQVSIDLVAYEAGPCGFSLYRSLREAGISAVVAAPSRIPRPVGRSAKTDSLDCRKLAEYAARDMLVPVTVPTEVEAGQRRVMRRRHKLTDSVRETKQQIRATLLECHLPEPPGLDTWSKTAQEALKTITAEHSVKTELDSLLRELDFLQKERVEIDQNLWSALNEKQKHRIENLQTVPGVGPILARTFTLEIFRPERFPDGEHLSSYVGLAPVVSQSGQSTGKAHLVRTGQRRLRSLFVECAWIHKAKDAAAGALYNRILSRTNLPQKAITAVARRLAVLLWRLSVEGRTYNP